MRSNRLSMIAILGAFAVACDPGSSEINEYQWVKGEHGKADSSTEAVFLDVEFDGQVLSSSSWNLKKAVEDQILYTVGQLNGHRSVGRLDRLELSAMQSVPSDGKTLISYHAKMPIAWGKKNAVPSTYTFILPRDVSYAAQEAFTKKYMHDCVDSSAHDVEVGTMWYYYRPEAYRCKLEEQDILSIEVTVKPSSIATTGKFPEYNKVWDDKVFRVVAVFGKYEDGATSDWDAGISAYNSFVRSIHNELQHYPLETIPTVIPNNPGVGLPDIELHATLPDGKRVEVVALLVDNVRAGGPAFDARYRELSSSADFIAYNGHSGLGANIRALARKGNWIAGQYVVVFMNGCDTYAYVDSALADAHAAVNADDPVGTKYVDIMMNAMPAFFHSDAPATMAVIRGLMRHDDPLTYEQIFAQIDRSQVVLVSGEEDNDFVPGGGGGGVENWAGMSENGKVAKNEEARFVTPKLARGKYLLSLTGTNDADLYVRIGKEPTATAYDCRPYRSGSEESCLVDLPAAAPIHIMVRGWASSSDFQLVGQLQ